MLAINCVLFTIGLLLTNQKIYSSHSPSNQDIISSDGDWKLDCHAKQECVDQDRKVQEENAKFTNFINALSQDQKDTLEQFFRLIIKKRYSGYVFFGDKPLCIEGWPIEDGTISLSGIDPDVFLFAKWLELWQDIGVSPYNKEFFFVNFDVDYGYHHLICINRQAFFKVVNDNIALFRYVLGPTLTAERLLQELIQAKDRFYDILKNDNVLLGILLGYGQQNALLVSREELIDDAFGSDRIEDFPFLAKTIRKKQTNLPKMQSLQPSLGFPSLAEEQADLKKKTAVSVRLKPFKICKIPHFGCDSSLKETQELLNRYIQNRSTIMGMLESENLLEETLKRLFSTASGILDIPKVPTKPFLPLSKNNDPSIDQWIEILFQEMKGNIKESYLRMLFLGMRANANGTPFLEAFEGNFVFEMHQLEADLKRAKNLKEADAYFSELDFQKELIPVVHERIYYRVIKQGTGQKLSNKVQNVSFYSHCQISSEADKIEDAGIVKQESIVHLIPGIALSLIGMQKGELREVHIHPEYGYGEDSYLPPNMIIVAKIELIDFSEGDHEALIFPPFQLERKNLEELNKKYDKCCLEDFYRNGIMFWQSVKEAHLINFETLEKCFSQTKPNFQETK